MTRRASKTYREPIVYEVGKDISREKYEELLLKVADWNREYRPENKEPAADARDKIRRCLEGKKASGEPWFEAWSASLRSRIAMICRFDLDKMEPIKKGDPAKKAAKQRAKDKATSKRLRNTAANDPMIPDIQRKTLDGRVKYGDRQMPITEGEQELWEEYRDAYLREFPELRTVNAKGELAMLCDLQVAHERNRLKLLSGQVHDAKELIDTAKLLSELKKALNIHPEQVAKRAKQEEGGSIAEAAARFDAMPQEVRDRFLAEELLILFQMYATPSPRDDMGGYQLDEVGLFGATRCRTCACAKCGTRNYAGLAIDDVTRYLADKGYLVPISETPVDEALAAASAAGEVEIQEGHAQGES